MTFFKHPKTLLAGAITCIALVSSAYVLADTTKTTLDAKSGGTLYLKTDVGSVEIDTHNRDEVLLEVFKDGRDADEFEVTHESKGKDVNIYGEVDSGWGSRQLRVEFKITVPENYNLEIETAGGSIDIEDLTGDVDAHTSGGSINVGKITGDVELDTSGGSITTEEIFGPLDAHTSGGSINVTFANQLTEDAELDTSGGSITAYLIPDIKVDINASTSGGRVKSQFDVDGRIKKHSVRGKINGGGPTLKLHTSGGSIKIRSL